MESINGIDQLRSYLKPKSMQSIAPSSKFVVPIDSLLEYLIPFEVGIEKEYYDPGAILDGLKNWFQEKEKRNVVRNVISDNTYDSNGNVLIDFGFISFDEIFEKCTYVILFFHQGNPYFLDSTNPSYKPILLKFKEGTSFYNVLDDFVLRCDKVPSYEMKIEGITCKIIPRIMDSYFVVDSKKERRCDFENKIFIKSGW